MQRLGEATLSAAGVQLGNEQASGGVPELHRGDQSEQVVPVFDDQLGLDRVNEQPPGVRVYSAPAGAGRTRRPRLRPTDTQAALAAT